MRYLKLPLAAFLFAVGTALATAAGPVTISSDSATASSTANAFLTNVTQTNSQPPGGSPGNRSATSTASAFPGSSDATAQNNSFANLSLSAPAPVTGTQNLLVNVGTAGNSTSGNIFGDQSASSGSGVVTGTFTLDQGFAYALTGSGTTGTTFSIGGVGAGAGPFVLGSSGFLSPGNYNFSVSTSGSSVNNSGAYNRSGSINLALTPVPEPATMALFGVSLLAAVGYRWRRNLKGGAATAC